MGVRLWVADVAARLSYLERLEARLIGAHRALCGICSFVHRGTPERPGLVLGLDQGGTCRGIAYRVAAAERSRTVAYLRARPGHRRLSRSVRAVWLKSEPNGACGALLHGRPRPRNMPGGSRWSSNCTTLRQGHGQSGANRDCHATVAALEQLGYRETGLHLLAEQLKARTRRMHRRLQADGASEEASLTRFLASSAWPSLTSRAVAGSMACCRR